MFALGFYCLNDTFLTSIFLGIYLMVIYAIIVWRIDCWERELIPLLVAAFLWGSIPSIIFALVGQVILGIPTNDLTPDGALFNQLYEASVVAPITEKLTKSFGLLLLFEREIDSVLYFAEQTDPGGLFLLFFLRAFVFGMIHALFTDLLGGGLALLNLFPPSGASGSWGSSLPF